MTSSPDKSILSSLPARDNIRNLEQQLLEEKKLSAKLQGSCCFIILFTHFVSY